MTKEVAISTGQPNRLSITETMAAQYGMDPRAFESTIQAVCIQKKVNGERVPATREEFAAFMLICREYNLNPLLKQVHAFVGQSGTVVPVIGIDGWTALINSKSTFEGMEFEWGYNANGGLESCTCRMFRNDRKMPTVITEFYDECKRNTDPWKIMPRRMMRHKTLIQTARVCFGFGGLHDDDEAMDIMAREMTPQLTSRRPPSPTGDQAGKTIRSTALIENEAQVTKTTPSNAAADQDQPTEEGEHSSAGAPSDASVEAAGADAHTPETSEPAATTIEDELPPGDARFDGDRFLDDLELEYADMTTEADLNNLWKAKVAAHANDLSRAQKDRGNEMYRRHQMRIEEEAAAIEMLGEETAKDTPIETVGAAAAGPGEDGKDAALQEDAKRISLVKGMINTLGHFTTEDDLASFWSDQVEYARESGQISADDFHAHLVPAHDEAFKRIKAGLTTPPAGAVTTSRRRPPAAPNAAGPDTSAEPAKAAAAAPSGPMVDPKSNEGQALLDRAFKKGKMAAGGGKAREVPADFGADPELKAAWLRGWDSNKPPGA